jgi:hypothetical protein
MRCAVGRGHSRLGPVRRASSPRSHPSSVRPHHQEFEGRVIAARA